MGQERKVLAQFDKNGDKRLDADERKAAREWLATQPASGFGGRGGFGRGGPPAPVVPGRKLAPADVKAYPGTVPLYDTATLRTMFLEFETSDWEQELAGFHNTDVEVPATLTVDGKKYPNVGVHFRGMSSYFMVPRRAQAVAEPVVRLRRREAAALRLQDAEPAELARGPDASCSTVLYSHIARSTSRRRRRTSSRSSSTARAGASTSTCSSSTRSSSRRTSRATQGRRAGRSAGSPGGRGGLEYLGDDVADYKRRYEIKTKDDEKAWKALINLCKVLNQTPPGQARRGAQADPRHRRRAVVPGASTSR